MEVRPGVAAAAARLEVATEEEAATAAGVASVVMADWEESD